MTGEDDHKILAALLALFLMQAVCLAKDPPQITDDTISDAGARQTGGRSGGRSAAISRSTVKAGRGHAGRRRRTEKQKDKSREGRQEGEGREAGGQQHRDQDARLEQMTGAVRLALTALALALPALAQDFGRSEIRTPGARVSLHRRPAWSKELGYLIFSDTPSDRLLKWVPGHDDRGLSHGCPRPGGQCLRRAGPAVHLRNAHAARDAHR